MLCERLGHRFTPWELERELRDNPDAGWYLRRLVPAWRIMDDGARARAKAPARGLAHDPTDGWEEVPD